MNKILYDTVGAAVFTIVFFGALVGAPPLNIPVWLINIIIIVIFDLHPQALFLLFIAEAAIVAYFYKRFAERKIG